MIVETIESGNHRAQVIREDCIEWPDWDGLGFVARIETGYNDSPRVEWVVEGDYVERFGKLRKEIPPYFDDALYRFGANGSDLETTIRYLKIFHDVAVADYVSDYRSGATYLILITNAQLQRWGTPADRVQEALKGTVETVQQVLDGDVYGYVIEERVTWQRLGSDGEPVFLVDDPTMTTWEEVDSLWGLYGLDYAIEEARAALEAEVSAA